MFQLNIILESGYLKLEGLLSKTGSYGRETLVIGRRQFDGLNTGLLAGGAVALGVGVLTMIMEAFGNTGLDTSPDPPEFRSSFFSIPIGR